MAFKAFWSVNETIIYLHLQLKMCFGAAHSYLINATPTDNTCHESLTSYESKYVFNIFLWSKLTEISMILAACSKILVDLSYCCCWVLRWGYITCLFPCMGHLPVTSLKGSITPTRCGAMRCGAIIVELCIPVKQIASRRIALVWTPAVEYIVLLRSRRIASRRIALVWLSPYTVKNKIP